MSTQPHSHQDLRCPQCHEPVRPDSAFCGNCGATMSGTATPEIRNEQATTTFTPISSNDGNVGYPEPSPWAPPDSDRYVAPDRVEQSTGVSSDPNATVIGSHPVFMDESARAERPESIRGFFLGILAMLLIAAVLSLYLYDAWLSNSTRETVESWLPWLNG
ncbi:MAG: zinc ribbon domain-containing protein [Chloroflexia bacterium]|nr:zinc ribbon domain-containing protein [Chloroflexia bacterium]